MSADVEVRNENGKRDTEDETYSTDNKRLHIENDVNDEKVEDLLNNVDTANLSKSQKKKLMKKMKWQIMKQKRRLMERLKRKQQRNDGVKSVKVGPSRKELKQCTMANSSCKICIVIDLSFDHLMIEKDLGKVIKQLLRVYTSNRRCSTPMQLYITNFEGKSKTEMSKHDGYEHWDVNFNEKSYLDIFPKEKLVYLTSESDNVITEIESDKVYIIGGLVDHNAHKGLCHKIAQEQGIMHGQLPIGEYLNMKTRKVLTINQVFEIILQKISGKNWKEALLHVIPMRKGAAVKDSEDESNCDDSTKDVSAEIPTEK